ncbi:O-antigen ligase family protein, partial [Acinetobacter baumannii]|uniref:O-antigen ligase family protein n=1 Tax=Acinetobacter baumannii TaxID=470 RepID=UPI0033331272
QIKCQVQKIVVPYRMIVLFLFVVMFLFAGYSLYKMKINSSDGRIFFWKNSVQMVMENPLGYGYGMFEKEYNLKQSAYFQNEKRDE